MRTDLLLILVVLAGCLVAALLAEVVLRRRRLRRRAAALPQTWGQDQRSDRTERPVDAWWRRIVGPRSDEGLDDVTWADLELDGVFGWLDRTLTAIGAQVLYGWLRHPEPSLASGRARLSLARALEPESVRVPLQRVLLDLGDHAGWDLGDLLATPLPRPGGPRWLYELMGRVALPAVVLAFASGRIWLIAISLLLLMTNATIHLVMTRRTTGHLDTLRALRAIVGAASRIWDQLPPEARARFEGLETIIAASRRRFRGSGLSDAAALPPGSIQEMGAEYHRTFVLTQVRAYMRVVDHINEHRDAYVELVDFVGQVDAAIGLAYVLAGPSTVCEPDRLPGGAPRLHATGIAHPRIEAPVRNDVDVGPRSLLVTGSNMAGKSTFLRTLGVNTILAQTIGVAFAESFTLSELRVLSSMHVQDDLGESVSLYQAELERVLVLLRAGERQPPCLVLLDEVFRGTNPTDRIAASGAVLLELARGNLVVAASHDLQLATLTETSFDVAHFTERAEEDGVVFDYRLRPGISVRTNALDLLERLGYPSTVVERARGFAADESVEATAAPEGDHAQ